MPTTIVATRLPADATQRGHLQKLLGSEGYSLLKEMVAAHCIVSQVDAMNALLYGDNEAAIEESKEKAKRAALINHALDFLDDFEKDEENWFTVKLQHAR